MPDEIDRTLAPDVRAHVAATLRARRGELVSDLGAFLRESGVDALEPEATAVWAAALVDLLCAGIESGRVDARSGGVVDLQAVCPEPVPVRVLFEAVHRAERLVLDELALDARVGATSEPWALVTELVRLAALDLQIAVTERFLFAPAWGLVRDELTTLVARPAFDLAVAKELDRAQRRGHAIALALFDVDRLSALNKALGYGAGDRLLERLGVLARRFFRHHDWVGRHGEDSIAVLLPETSLDAAAALGQRFRATVRQRLLLVDHRTDERIPVTVSAAVVGAERLLSHLEPATLVGEAEAALLRAKMNGVDQMERVALQPPSVTLRGAANLLDCSLRDIRRLVRCGELAAAKRGRHYHIDRASIDRYRARRTLPF